MGEDIERIFLDDIREKRRVGSGAFHVRGKGVKHGFSGALRTPYHFMKTKERNALNGIVETSNIYSSILNWTEWSLKDRETQKQLLTKWRELYPNTKIMEELQIGRNKPFNVQSFADIVNDLGCPPKNRQAQIRREKKEQKEKRKVKNIAATPKKQESTLLQFELPEPPKEEIKAILISNGLHLEYNGEYDQEQLTKIFTKLQLLIDSEPNKFKIALCLTEVE